MILAMFCPDAHCDNTIKRYTNSQLHQFFHKPRFEHVVGWVSGLDVHTQEEGSKQRVAA